MVKYTFIAVVLAFFSLMLCCCDSSDSSVLDPAGGELSAEQALVSGLQFFLDEAKARNVYIDPLDIERLDLISRNMPPGVLGSCRETKEGRLEVAISGDIHDEDLEWIILHELGHCLLGMVHRDGNISLMNTEYVAARLTGLSRKAILDEFFQPEFFYEH